MKRRETPRDPRFLTFSCYRRLPLLGTPALRRVFVEEFAAVHSEFAFRIHAWVVMPEHVHLLIVPRDGQVTSILAQLKSRVGRRVVARWRELRAPILTKIKDGRGAVHFWQPGGGHDHNVRSISKLGEKIAYIHRNPVKRGLVESADIWESSSVHWWLGQSDQSPTSCYPGGRLNWAAWRGFM